MYQRPAFTSDDEFLLTDVDVYVKTPMELVAEASALRWPPGHFPRTMHTTLGNKQPFVLQSIDEMRAVYVQEANSLELIVWND